MSVRDDLKAYVDGELPLGRMDEVRAAIERDPGLAREVAELRLLSTALRSVDASSPVVGLDDALAALRRRNWKHTPWITWPLGVAAACLAAGLIVVAQHAGQKTMDSSGTVAMEDRESARAPGASMDLQKAAKEPAPSVASPQRASKSAPALKSSPPEPSLSAPALPAAAPSVRVARDRAATRSAALLKARMITPGQKDASANTLANSRKGPSFPLGGATVPGLQDGSATVNASRPARTKPSLLNANTVAAAGELNLRSGSPAMSFGVPAPAPIVVEVPSIGDAESRLRAASFAYTKLRGSNSPDGPPVEIVIDVPEARVLAALVAARGADAQSNSHAYRAIESGQGGGGNRVEGGGFGGRAGAGGFGGGVGAPGPSRGFAQSAAPTPTPPGGRSPQDLTPGLPKAVAQRPVDGDAGKQLATVPPKQPQSDAAGVWYNATPQQLPAKNAQTAGRSKSTVLGTKQVPVPQAPRDAITNNRGTATQTGALSANQGQSVLLTSPTANSKNAPMRRIIVILRQKPPAGKLEP